MNVKDWKWKNASLAKNIQTVEQESDTQIQELRHQLTELETERQNAVKITEIVRNEYKQEISDMQAQLNSFNKELEEAKVCIAICVRLYWL